MNSHILKITGSAELSGELDPSQTVSIKGADVDIYAVEKRDNQDGTFTVAYKGKITSAVDYEQSGKVMRGADKKGKSKKLRGAIWLLAHDEGVDDYDIFYEVFMDKIIANLPEIWERFKLK